MTSDPIIYSLCKAIDAMGQIITNAISVVSVLNNIGNQPSDVTDLLALEQRTPYYDQALPLSTRQALLSNTGHVNSIKGTKAAIEEVAAAVFGRCTVDEWFQYGGDPYCFKVNVDVSQQGASDAELTALNRIIDQCKNVRSYLDEINIYLTSSGKVYLGGATTGAEEVTIYPWATTTISNNGIMYFGAGQQAVETITIYPA